MYSLKRSFYRNLNRDVLVKMILVLGKMLEQDGSLGIGYTAQINHVTQMLYRDQMSFVVISGGFTRPEYISEARAGFEQIPPDLQNRVTLEERSLSTRQNIENVRELVKGRWVTEIIVVSSGAHSFRVEYLFWKYWPEAKYMLSFSPAYTSSFKEWVLQLAIYGMSRLDPNEKFFLRIKRALLD